MLRLTCFALMVTGIMGQAAEAQSRFQPIANTRLSPVSPPVAKGKREIRPVAAGQPESKPVSSALQTERTAFRTPVIQTGHQRSDVELGSRRPLIRPAVFQQPVPEVGPPIVNVPAPTSTAPVLPNPTPADGCIAQTAPTLNGVPYPTSIAATPVVQQRYLSPVISLRPIPSSTYVAPGILGQPKAYVKGQPVRNFIRYIFP